jgi:hypothetical protein
MEGVICSRCNAKEAMFNCLMCDSFKNLCNKCDNYLHSLPSKKLHKREALNVDKLPKEDNMKGSLLNSLDREKNISMTVHPNTGGEWKVDLTVLPTTSATIPTSTGRPDGLIAESYKHMVMNHNYNSSNQVGSNGTCTKEYVNEIKVFAIFII